MSIDLLMCAHAVLLSKRARQRGGNQRPKISIWSAYFHLLFALFVAVRIVAGFEDVAVMGQAIQGNSGHLGVAKAQIGGDDQRG